jgi:polysaccharide biosynthesis protein PslH
MAINGLNILYTTVHFPFPPIGGDRIKQLKILEHLAKRNKIFLVSLDRGYEITDRYVEEIRNLGIEPFVFKINKYRAYLSAALLAPFGLPMEINFFRHPMFKRKVNEILSDNNIDLIISYYLRTTHYTRQIKAKKILVSDDCRTFYQSRTASESTNLRQRLIRKLEANRLRKYESEISDYYDVTTFVTKEDLAQMSNLNNKAKLRILSNGVDTEKFFPPDNDNHRRDVIFTGKLDAWVNNLMVRRIVENIFPKIKQAVPDTRLHIVGSKPTEEILSYRSESIFIHPDVPDFTPYLQNSAVYMHAHLGGSGIQNKLLEAMACGCPVITNKSGAWGFNIENGVNGFMAENDDEFAAIAIKLLKDPELVKTIGTNARKYIVENHTWDQIYSDLENIISEVIEL